MSDYKVYYQIGFRDGLACILGEARARGDAGGLLTAAETLHRMDPENPHARWLLQRGKAQKEETDDTGPGTPA